MTPCCDNGATGQKRRTRAGSTTITTACAAAAEKGPSSGPTCGASRCMAPTGTFYGILLAASTCGALPTIALLPFLVVLWVDGVSGREFCMLIRNRYLGQGARGSRSTHSARFQIKTLSLTFRFYSALRALPRLRATLIRVQAHPACKSVQHKTLGPHHRAPLP